MTSERAQDGPREWQRQHPSLDAALASRVTAPLLDGRLNAAVRQRVETLCMQRESLVALPDPRQMRAGLRFETRD